MFNGKDLRNKLPQNNTTNARQNRYSVQHFASLFSSEKASFLIYGAAIGTVIGVVVSVFRLIIDHTLQGLLFLYPYMRANPEYIALYVAGTAVVGFMLINVIKPLYAQKTLHWWSALWRTFVGALLALCPGIFAGREGPCIKMGAQIAESFCDKAFHNAEDKKQVLIHTGMAAGLSAAFSAPIAGTLFILEAVSFNFTPVILFTSMTASIASVITTYFFFGSTPGLYVDYGLPLPFDQYWQVLALGVFIGIMCRIFQSVLFATRSLYGKLPLKTTHNILIPLFLVIPFGLIYAPMLGGSHDYIKQITSQQFLLSLLQQPLPMILGFLALMTVGRLVFTAISTNATAPTGIFMPILVLGALSGAIYAMALIKLGIISEKYYLNLVICAMAAFFGSSLKAPFTGVILLVETVGNVTFIMPILIVTWIATLVNTWLGGRSVYS